MRPDTDCICVYGFAMDIVTDYSQLTQGSVREDASYSCITMIFEGGVVSNSYEKCFFRTPKVVKWITKVIQTGSM
jgi:hypothetical protein